MRISSITSSRPSGVVPNSNLVSAMMMPRGAAKVRPASYSPRLACFRRSASDRPSACARRANVTFSSCPTSALVAGEKMGGSRRALSTSPPGSGSPASVPDRWYSAQAEPVM